MDINPTFHKFGFLKPPGAKKEYFGAWLTTQSGSHSNEFLNKFELCEWLEREQKILETARKAVKP